MIKPRNFSDLIMPSFGVKSTSRNFKYDAKVYGWDSETYDGKVTLIAVASETDTDYCVPKSYKELLEFVTQRKFRRGYNFFYNLGYDMNAIIKSMPINCYNVLQFGNEYKDYEFKLSRIGKKCMDIGVFKDVKIDKYNNQHYEYFTSKFFDIWIFYQCGSLEYTYFKTFNRPYKKRMKLNEGIKRNEITHEHIKYCIEDAYACYELAQHLVNITNKISPIRNYFSPASLAKAMVKNNLQTMYGCKEYKFIPTPLNQAAFYAYNGGRFEVFKKGHFNEGYNYDINSAYPYAMSNLNTINGKERETKEVNYDSLHGFYKINCYLEDFYVGPLKYLFKNLLIYPNGEIDNWVTLDEIRVLDELQIDYNIVEGWELYGENSKPMRFIEDMYYKRMKLKKKNDPLQLYYKLCLNSLYGIMVQITAMQKIDEFGECTLEKISKLCKVGIPIELRKFGKVKIKDLPEEFDYNIYSNWIEKIYPNLDVENIDDKIYIKNKIHRVGAFFNPIWGSEITANTRNTLFRNSNKNVLMFATDSIMTSSPIKVPISDKLGEWEGKHVHDIYILASGIYSYLERDNKRKTSRCRGLRRGIDLTNIFNCDKNFYEIKINRPVGLREGLQEHLKEHGRFNMFNTFQEHRKYLSPIMDKKRNWLKEPAIFKDLLHNIYHSRPLIL